jgi:hypothetical protein
VSVEDIMASIELSKVDLDSANGHLREAEAFCEIACARISGVFEGTGNEEAVLALQQLGALVANADVQIRAIQQAILQLGNLRGTI